MDEVVERILKEISRTPPTRKEIIKELDRRLSSSADDDEKASLLYLKNALTAYPHIYEDYQNFTALCGATEHALRKLVSDKSQLDRIRKGIDLMISLKRFIYYGKQEETIGE